MRKHSEKHPCPVCNYLVFSDAAGSYDICPICFWEDDLVQLAFPDMAGGANKVSLIEAQNNFAKFGVSEQRFKGNVRKATEVDSRDKLWRPINIDKDIYLHWNSEIDRNRWQSYKDKQPLRLYYWQDDYWLKRT